MLTIMNTQLTLSKGSGFSSFPPLWWFDRTTEGVRYSARVTTRSEESLLTDLEQLHQAGVRGEIHLTTASSLEYIRYSLMDKGVFKQTGEVIWTSKLEEVN